MNAIVKIQDMVAVRSLEVLAIEREVESLRIRMRGGGEDLEWEFDSEKEAIAEFHKLADALNYPLAPDPLAA